MSLLSAEVRRRVQLIAETSRDYEAAHGMEDALWRDVLLAIAGGQQNAQRLAEEALRTQDILFPRYTA